jgi:hypothetical protein
MTKFRSDLRAQVLRAADLLDGSVDPGDDGERLLLARARRLAAAIDSPPPPSAHLASRAFFEAILDRASRQSAGAIGPAELRAAFAPMAAPKDVEWVEPSPSPLVARVLRAAPVGPTPGWLRRPNSLTSRTRRRTARFAASLVAAILLVALGLGAFYGTTAQPDFVFIAVDRPLSFDHPSDWLRAMVDSAR